MALARVSIFDPELYLFSGGADTVRHSLNVAVARVLFPSQTVSALASFMLAMVRNPDIQKKAQNATDDVIGKDRLPNFSDYASIPCVDAIVKEVYRWRPVTPLGMVLCFRSYRDSV